VLLCHAVARHIAGDHAGAERDLEQARELVDNPATRTLMRMVGEAHRTCRSPHEVEIRRAVLELPDSVGVARIADLAALGNALFREERWDEAADVERQAWETCRQVPDVPPATVRLVGMNLVATLEQRRGEGDVDAALAIRRELLAPEGEDRVDDLLTLGAILYNNDRYAEAEEMETLAWNEARAGGAGAGLVHTAGGNLIMTLVARGEEPTSERVLEIRRELLERAGDPLAQARNLVELAKAVGDRHGQAVGLARCAVAEPEPAAKVSALDALAIVLSSLDRPALALEVSAMSLAYDADLAHEDVPLAARRVAALAPILYPRGVQGLEERLREAGITTHAGPAGATAGLAPAAAEGGGAFLGGLLPGSGLPAAADHDQHGDDDGHEQEAPEPGDVADPAERQGDELHDAEAE
jgi:tetratricopeptide (TPR) repeat protein